MFACIYIFIKSVAVCPRCCSLLWIWPILFAWKWEMDVAVAVAVLFSASLFLFICFFGKRVLSIFTSTHFSHQLFSNFYENDERDAFWTEVGNCVQTLEAKRNMNVLFVCTCSLPFFLCVETHTRNCNLHLNRVNKYTC